MTQLLPYQIEGVQKTVQFLNSNKSVYNGSDPGLGKTIMTCASFKPMEFKRILIICPAGMRLTWEEQARIWCPQYKTYLVINSERDFKKICNQEIIIISYELISIAANCGRILREKFDCLVMDEAHKLKSTKSNRTKAILNKIWANIPYRIALSGTPFLSCITDCYPVFSRMSPDSFGTYNEFGTRFSNIKWTPWGPKFEGIRDPKLLSDIIRSKFFFRYKKDEVLKELPPKIYNKIILPHSLSIDVYEQALRAIYPDIDLEPNLELLKRIPNHLMGLMRLQGELKCDAIAEYVSDLLDQGIPVILFAVNKSVIARYKELLKSYNPVCITGETTPYQRQHAEHSFQAGTTKLFIGNIQAAGVGITLTASSNVVLAQTTFSPAEVLQAIDRAHRYGQKDVVNVHWFVVKGSIDERIMETILRKAKDFGKILN